MEKQGVKFINPRKFNYTILYANIILNEIIFSEIRCEYRHPAQKLLNMSVSFYTL